MSNARVAVPRRWLTWVTRLVALTGLAVVAWAGITAWGAIVHGHPAFAVLLGVTTVLCGFALLRSFGSPPMRGGWRLIARIIVLALAVLGIAVLAWLRPFSAEEPALAAMQSDAVVTVTETPTRIVFTPATAASTTAVFFEPGAKVEARAYAATLRPLAEAGYTVVIAKQPLAIAFLSLGEFESVRADYPAIEQWIVGGHSLGGVVASIQADDGDSADGVAPVVGLVLYASFPATDMSTSLTAGVLSVSAASDGLATPTDIDAAKPLLPAETIYVQIAGAVHAFFADYGAQPGDGTPTVSHSVARAEISAATLDFVRTLSGD